MSTDEVLSKPVTRRGFVRVLGAGLLFTVTSGDALGQRKGGRGGGRGGGPQKVAARIHVGRDGVITVMTGKVEGGQGARAELSQAAAEELRVPLSQIRLVMADTSLVPDDGVTAGSGSTPRTVPAVRQGAAAAQQLLAQLAGRRWDVDAVAVEIRDGKFLHPATKRTLSYAELATSEDLPKRLDQLAPSGINVSPVTEWRILGKSAPRPNGRDLVTGAHKYPSDMARPGMLYGRILRPPSYGARLVSIDLARARAMKDAVVVQDGSLVGVAAPTKLRAAGAGGNRRNRQVGDRPASVEQGSV